MRKKNKLSPEDFWARHSQEYPWATGPWKPTLITVDYSDEGKATYYSPTCRHERTSYDIQNCDACQAYSLKRSRER